MLAPYTTFKTGGEADYYTEARSVGELNDALVFAEAKGIQVSVLGGGSNVLISDYGVRGLVVRIINDEILVGGVNRNGAANVRVGAGVKTDSLIQCLCERSLWGMENLSRIPGTIGGAIVQNAGAYGVEIGDVVQSVTVFDMRTKALKTLLREECAFAYRDSIFARGSFVVMEATLIVSTKSNPQIEYPGISDRLTTLEDVFPMDIRDAILSIRREKLPDMSKVGTAGSYFKNPTVSKEEFEVLQQKYPSIPHFDAGHDRIKIPLAWVLDKVLHLKGYREGNVALYEKQPIIIVAYEGATTSDILEFAHKIESIVREETGITIEREVKVIS